MESMKKFLFVLAFVGLSSYALAQTSEVPTKKYSVATNSFWSNWFIQVGADWNSYYSDEEHGIHPRSVTPFKGYRSNPGASIAVGKWFTPGLGLRTKVSGMWGKSVFAHDVVRGEAVNVHSPMNKYWMINEQVLFNLSNMLCGYNSKRVWNFIPFLGGGFARSMTHNFYAMDLNVGILNNFRITKNFGIYLELGWNRLEEDFDGFSGSMIDGHKLRGWEDKDNILYGELGFTFNLGKATWDNVPDVDALMAMNKEQIDALNASLRDAQNENARLKALLDKKSDVQPQTIVKKEIATVKQSVFFNLNSAKIASRKDLVNVQEVAKFAIANGKKLLVTGSADSATGTPKINQSLSERRAEAVVQELVKMGVKRENITVKALGGINELSPISYNRRATVEIK